MWCFFSGIQQDAIITSWKNCSCLLYRFCMMVTIFKEASSKVFYLLYFQQRDYLWHNRENKWKVTIYFCGTSDISIIINFGMHTPKDSITNFICYYHYHYFVGGLFNSIAVVWNAQFFSILSWEHFLFFMLQSIPSLIFYEETRVTSADTKQLTESVGFHFK